VPSRGGLGAPCTANADCAGNICASQNGSSTCTRTCDATNTCPRDYECVVTSDGVTSVCQERPRTSVTGSGCGRCAAAAGSPRPLAWASLSVLGLLLAARRRARRAH
jgi:MYXO-CTERM domain-containing protein